MYSSEHDFDPYILRHNIIVLKQWEYEIIVCIISSIFIYIYDQHQEKQFCHEFLFFRYTCVLCMHYAHTIKVINVTFLILKIKDILQNWNYLYTIFEYLIKLPQLSKFSNLYYFSSWHRCNMHITSLLYYLGAYLWQR